MSEILSAFDPDIAGYVRKILESRRITFHPGATSGDVQHVGRVIDHDDPPASHSHGGRPDACRPRTFLERSTGIQNLDSTDALAVQLIEASGVRDACDLDLLLFFARHPRVVLTSERLAAYVGYELVEVARALDRLLGSGVLKRALNHGTPGRMYVLDAERAEEWLEPIRRVCATPDGRHALRALLRGRRSQAEIPLGEPSHRHFSGARAITSVDGRR